MGFDLWFYHDRGNFLFLTLTNLFLEKGREKEREGNSRQGVKRSKFWERVIVCPMMNGLRDETRTSGSGRRANRRPPNWSIALGYGWSNLILHFYWLLFSYSFSLFYFRFGGPSFSSKKEKKQIIYFFLTFSLQIPISTVSSLFHVLIDENAFAILPPGTK